MSTVPGTCTCRAVKMTLATYNVASVLFTTLQVPYVRDVDRIGRDETLQIAAKTLVPNSYAMYCVSAAFLFVFYGNRPSNCVRSSVTTGLVLSQANLVQSRNGDWTAGWSYVLSSYRTVARNPFEYCQVVPVGTSNLR